MHMVTEIWTSHKSRSQIYFCFSIEIELYFWAHNLQNRVRGFKQYVVQTLIMKTKV